MGSPEISKKQQVAEAIAARILRNEWSKGERLPGTKTFAAEYECSETTIYDAFDILRREGLVRGKRGGRYRA